MAKSRFVRSVRNASPPTPYGSPTGFYDYDEPRRRSVWPWLLALVVVVAAAAGGWYVYTKVQAQLNQTKPVSAGRCAAPKFTYFLPFGLTWSR